jgi:hypothetical protein
MAFKIALAAAVLLAFAAVAHAADCWALEVEMKV